jgi:Gpi18-like mannosyltransferase
VGFFYFWDTKSSKQMSDQNQHRSKFILAVGYTLLFALLVLFLPERGHGGDIGHWERWAQFILNEGLANIYSYGLVVETQFPCNYPPLILYLMTLFAHIMGNVDAITANAHYFKVIPLVFDFIGAMLVFLLIRPAFRFWWLPLLLLLNPAYLYNSYLWGQLDSILTAFVVAALICAIRRQVYWATILFALALHTKFQSVVFVPVFFLAIFPAIRSWRTLINMIILGATALIIPLLPFLLGSTIDQWYTVMTGLVDQYRNVSLNAFNFWQFFHEGQGALYAKDYQSFWFGITYKTWGLVLFFSFSFISLLPLFLRTLKERNLPNSESPDFTKLVLISAYLCALGFFFFNTQMHERYSHPALLLAFLYGVLQRNYWLYTITAIAYFLNMETILQFFSWNYEKLYFQKDFVAMLFLIAILYGLYQLYRNYDIRSNIKYLFQYFSHNSDKRP